MIPGKTKEIEIGFATPYVHQRINVGEWGTGYRGNNGVLYEKDFTEKGKFPRTYTFEFHV